MGNFKFSDEFKQCVFMRLSTKLVKTLMAGSLLSAVATLFFPPLYYLIYQQPLLFVNAWDEETYLTLAAAESLKITGGYSSLWLISVLIGLGVNGSIINVFSDLLLMPIIVITTAVTGRRVLKLSKLDAIVAAFIIFFAGVLFNYANPLVAALAGDRSYGSINVGWENYPAILRTPNPQYSYALIVFAAGLASILRSLLGKIALVLAPLPFIYTFPLIAYVFVLCLIAGWHISAKITPVGKLMDAGMRLLVLGVLAWLGLGASMLIAKSAIFARFPPVMSGLQLVQTGHGVFWTLHLLIGVVCLAIVLLLSWAIPNDEKENCNSLVKEKHLTLRFIVLVMMAINIAMFFTSNPQIITGFLPVPKNSIDYSLSILIGIVLACSFVYILKIHPLVGRLTGLGMVMCITTVLFSSNGFVYGQQKWRLMLNSEIAADRLSQIRANPCHFFILDRDLAAKLSYGLGLAKHLPFSYQNQFALPGGDLAFHTEVLAKAADNLTPSELEYYRGLLVHFEKLAALTTAPIDEKLRCTLRDFPTNGEIQIVRPEKLLRFVMAPDW